MSRDNSNQYRKSSPKDAPLFSLSPTGKSKLDSQNEKVCCVSKWGAGLSIYTSLARVKCLFTGRADFSIWVGKPTFIIFMGLLINCWGRLLILPITIFQWPIRKRGFGPNTITDMINPMNKIIIIIRMLFTVTLFQHSPLTRRVFFQQHQAREVCIISGIRRTISSISSWNIG